MRRVKPRRKERGCGEAQPQQLHMDDVQNIFKRSQNSDALRLVSATQPRSGSGAVALRGNLTWNC
jgi:hypothetical protein